jgi:hypothetical protein
MSYQLRGVGLALAGFIALALAVAGTARAPAIAAAVVFFLLAGSTLSRARRLAAPLRRLVGRRVAVTVWGSPLGSPGEELALTSASAFGAGLLIRLRPAGSETAVLLKVAQPQKARVTDSGLVVQEAAYVQWAGKRLPRQAGSDAVVLIAALS